MGDILAIEGAAIGKTRSHARASADLVGQSAAMCQLRATVAQVAASSATVLLTGPTGAGKENVARALHAASARGARSFEAVNCGAIPANLAESELFGAEAGAFTGAGKARIGKFEAAQGGTLFLDEIGDLPLDMQVKLLRVLETREVERLGGSRAIPVDVRIIAATNVDLEASVAEGRFRADLYWRLAVVWIDIPPLADRSADIPALVAHFADAHRQRVSLTACGEAALAAHPWPGNLRELRNFVDRALAHGERCLDAPTVARVLVPRRRPPADWLQASQTAVTPGLTRGPAALGNSATAPQLKSLLAEAEAALIADALTASNGTIAHSARLLGLKRTTLIEKMRRLGLKAAANEAA
jgi:sigma-54 dependent transcriptional regulator, flagellar regulatory protein